MKGPWSWSESGTQLIDADGRTVLRIRPSDATPEEFAAIAAVPDLLAALAGCEDRLTREGTAKAWPEIDAARATLAKIREA